MLGAQSQWAEQNPEALAALLRSIYRAAQWCAASENVEELAQLLAETAYVDRPADWMLPALTGEIATGSGETIDVADFFLTHEKAAPLPWKSHALWFYSQMVRWGQVPHSAANAEIALQTYRPDLYRAALKPLGVALPGANAKVEGALQAATPVGSAGASLTLGPDGFFDGGLFDPDELDSYIAAQASDLGE